LEAADLDLSLAYAINTLFWMYLRVQGVAPADHPVTLELKRIREYMERLKAAKAEAAGGGEAGAAAASKAQQSKLNIEAAQRFIKAGLGRDGEAVTEDLWADEDGAPAAGAGAPAAGAGADKKKRKGDSSSGAPAKVAKGVDGKPAKEKKKSKKKSSKSAGN
jgi:hypothetical protein